MRYEEYETHPEGWRNLKKYQNLDTVSPTEPCDLVSVKFQICYIC